MLYYIKKYISKEYRVCEKYSYEWEDIKNADIVWFHNISSTVVEKRFSWLPRILYSSCPIINYYKKRDRPKLVGGVRGNNGFERSKRFLKYFDAIHTSNRYLLKMVSEININSYLLYAGVDTEVFYPNLELRPNEFIIGWAGDRDKKMKNYNFIHKLEFPFKVATKQNYIPHNKMPDFYNSLSTYTYFSTHEGCNRTILEACACGLPVVSTDAGTVTEILEPDWIVPVYPFKSNRIVKEIKERLGKLEADENLRNKVGMKNRNVILNWDWKVIVKQVEHILDEVYLHS